MTKTLEMTFRNNSGKEVVLSLPNPKDDITKASVETAMKSITDKNIFTSTGGDLKEIVEAKIRVLEVTTLA